MYAESIGGGDNGAIASIPGKYCAVLATAGNAYLEPIPEVAVAADCTLTIDSTEISATPATNSFQDGNKIRAATWTFSWN